MRKFLFSLLALLAGCSAEPVKPDPDQRARQVCMRALTGRDIHSADDFVRLGQGQREEAVLAPTPEEKKRKTLCALSAFEAAAFLSPQDPVPYRAAADTYFDLRKLPAATAGYRRVLQLDSRSPGARLRLAQIERNDGHIPEAVRLLEEEMRVNPTFADVYLERGNIEMTERNFASARNYFSGALKRNAQYEDAYFGRAVAEHLLGDLGAALRDMKAALRISPEKSELLWEMALLREDRKEPAEAEAVYHQFQSLVARDSPEWARAEKRLQGLKMK